jgi:outer membrane protein TolC
MKTDEHPARTKAGALAGMALAALLAGCASLSPDAGFGDVQAMAAERLPQDLHWARTETDKQALRTRLQELLAQPLSADDAVQIALLANPGLQARYSDLGIAEADLVQAGRLHNPGFSFARLARAGEFEYERRFVFDVFGLLALPARTRLETQRFEQTKLAVTAEVLRVAARTRRAYVGAVAARQTARYMDEVRTAGEASAELAARMARVGNWSKLDQARQQAFYVETLALQAKAKAAEFAARENLTRLLGLWGADAQFKLPERLPDLPKAPLEYAKVEQEAVARRLDVQMAKQRAASLAHSLGLTKATRFVNVIELAYLNNSETGLPRQTGYEIELQLPIFDWGEARVAKAEAIYMQALNRVAAAAVNARSQARAAYAGYRSAYDVARHYRDELVPLRQAISDENVLRYNGMLIGVFELLAGARAQMAGVNLYINAARDFWIADADLRAATTGTGAGLDGGVIADLSAPSGDSAAGH